MNVVGRGMHRGVESVSESQSDVGEMSGWRMGLIMAKVSVELLNSAEYPYRGAELPSIATDTESVTVRATTGWIDLEALSCQNIPRYLGSDRMQRKADIYNDSPELQGFPPLTRESSTNFPGYSVGF